MGRLPLFRLSNPSPTHNPHDYRWLVRHLGTTIYLQITEHSGNVGRCRNGCYPAFHYAAHVCGSKFVLQGKTSTLSGKATRNGCSIPTIPCVFPFPSCAPAVALLLSRPVSRMVLFVRSWGSNYELTIKWFTRYLPNILACKAFGDSFMLSLIRGSHYRLVSMIISASGKKLFHGLGFIEAVPHVLPWRVPGTVLGVIISAVLERHYAYRVLQGLYGTGIILIIVWCARFPPNPLGYLALRQIDESY